MTCASGTGLRREGASAGATRYGRGRAAEGGFPEGTRLLHAFACGGQPWFVHGQWKFPPLPKMHLSLQMSRKEFFPYFSELMMGRTNSKNWARWILHSCAYGMQFGKNREVRKRCVCVGGGGFRADKWLQGRRIDHRIIGPLNRAHQDHEHRGGLSKFSCSSPLFHSLDK